ncbi:MAG: hypothetical protein ACSHWU_00665 [Marinicella sp.]
MSTQLLSQSTLHRQAEIKAAFLAATPFKYVVIDDFFTRNYCQSLLEQFPEFKAQDAIDENQKLGKKAVVQTVQQLGGAYKKLDQLVKSKTFLNMIEDITGLDDLIYDPHYIGGGTHNNLHGQELDPR